MKFYKGSGGLMWLKWRHVAPIVAIAILAMAFAAYYYGSATVPENSENNGIAAIAIAEPDDEAQDEDFMETINPESPSFDPYKLAAWCGAIQATTGEAIFIDEVWDCDIWEPDDPELAGIIEGTILLSKVSFYRAVGGKHCELDPDYAKRIFTKGCAIAGVNALDGTPVTPITAP